MKERFLHNWHITRMVYLLIGATLSAYSIVNKEWTGLLPGGYFMIMAIMHFGCAKGGCYVESIKNRENNAVSLEPVFEEIK